MNKNKLTPQEEADLMSCIAKAYSFSDVTDCNVYIRSKERIFSRFRCEQGEMLLKEWPLRQKYGDQKAQALLVMEIAHSAGVPVAPFLDTVSHKKFFIWSNRKLSVQEVVGNGTCDISNENQVREFAKALGKLHQATWHRRINENSWSVVSMSADYLDVVRAHIVSVDAASKGFNTFSETVEALSYKLKYSENRMRLEGWEELPLIPVHGDYHHHNVRYIDDELVAIVDFDQARYEPRIYDIAYALGHLYGTFWPDEKVTIPFWTGSRSISQEQYETWLGYYLEEGPALSPQERKLLPLACAAVWPRIIESSLPKSEKELLSSDSVLQYMNSILEIYRNSPKPNQPVLTTPPNGSV